MIRSRHFRDPLSIDQSIAPIQARFCLRSLGQGATAIQWLTLRSRRVTKVCCFVLLGCGREWLAIRSLASCASAISVASGIGRVVRRIVGQTDAHTAPSLLRSRRNGSRVSRRNLAGDVLRRCYDCYTDRPRLHASHVLVAVVTQTYFATCLDRSNGS